MSGHLVLLGGGGHASDVLAAVEGSDHTYRVMIADDAVVDRRRFEQRAEVLEGSLEEAFRLDAVFICAIGYPSTRARVVARADAAGVIWADCVVHSRASVHSTASVGSDSVIFGQTWVSPHVAIGAHSSLGYGVTVGHDTQLDAFAAVMPGAVIGGEVRVGRGVLVGANATVLQGLSIGDDAVIGAGAVVTRDVEAGCTVVGAPARPVATS